MTSHKRVLAALLCAAALLALTACGAEGDANSSNAVSGAETPGRAGTETAQDAGIAVQTRAVEAGAISSDSTVSGMISADDEAMVMVAVTAKCLETFAEAGDQVEEGQILCRLELDSTLSSYHAAQLNYNAAVQSYNDQAAVFSRQIAALNEQVALAEKQVPQAEQQVVLAQEQAAQAERQIPLLERQVAQGEQQIPLLEQQITQGEQQMIQARQQIAMYEQQQAMVDKNLEDTKALYAIGAASQAEVDNAEFSLTSINLQVDQAKLQLNQAAMQVDQLKMQLDQTKLQVDQAKMQLDQTRLQVDQAKMQADQAGLSPDQARLQVSQAQLQLQSAVATRNSTLSQLQASIESARSSVQQMESALENIDDAGNVTAPISGTLVTMNAMKDNYVSSTLPVAVINGTGTMEITVLVSETLISKLHAGDEADVSVAALGRSFTAPIRSVDQAANAQTRLYSVTLSVPETVTGLLSGMFADVTFHTDGVENAVVIPSEAILTSGGVQYVYVVENGAARYTEVTTGLTGSGVTEVTGGLSAGAQLVTVGQSYLSDGAAVRVVGEG